MKVTTFPQRFPTKLRFCLKPGNREPIFECWDESSGSLRTSRSQRAGLYSKTIKSISRHKACRLLVIEPVRSHTWENLVVLYHILSGNLKSTLRNSYLSVWVRSDTNVYLERMNVSRTTYLVVNIIILQFVLLGKILLPKLVCFGILFGKVVHF